MKPHIQPATRLKQILNFLIAFGAAEVLVEVEHHEFGHLKTQRTRHLAAYQFGNQRLGAVTGTPEFHHILESVVGLGKSRKRTSFAQWCHITCDLLSS